MAMELSHQENDLMTMNHIEQTTSENTNQSIHFKQQRLQHKKAMSFDG